MIGHDRADLRVDYDLDAQYTPPSTWHGGRIQGGRLLTVLRDAHFWRIVPLTFFLAGTLMGFQGLWADPYLFDVLNTSAIEAGNVMVVLAVGTFLGYGTSGWLCDRFGLVRVLIVASAIFVACQAALAMRPSLFVVAGVYGVFGFTGGFNVMLVAQARKSFPCRSRGRLSRR